MVKKKKSSEQHLWRSEENGQTGWRLLKFNSSSMKPLFQPVSAEYHLCSHKSTLTTAVTTHICSTTPVCLVETAVESGCTGLQRRSPELIPIEHLWGVVEQETHVMDVHLKTLLQQQNDNPPKWASVADECFQHQVEFMP